MLNLSSYLLLDYMLGLDWMQRPGRSDPVSNSVLPSAELPRLLTDIDPEPAPSCRHLRHDRGGDPRLLAAVQDQDRFRVPRLRREPRRRPLCRHARLADHRARHGDAPARSRGLPAPTRCSASSAAPRRAFRPASASTPFRSRLLGRSHPVGVLFAGLLFGALEAGGRQMQVDAGVSIDLIGIIQSLIIVFIAAPLLVRAIFPWGFQRSPRRDARSNPAMTAASTTDTRARRRNSTPTRPARRASTASS